MHKLCKSYAKWYAKFMHLCNASILFIYLFVYIYMYCTLYIKGKNFFRHEEKNSEILLLKARCCVFLNTAKNVDNFLFLRGGFFCRFE